MASGLSYTPTGLENNDLISCGLTSTATCALPGTVIRNQIKAAVNQAPAIIMEKSVDLKDGELLTLHPLIYGTISSYSWAPADGLTDPRIQNPVAAPTKTTGYTLKVIPVNGCEVNTTITVRVLQRILTIPNTFTPNGDGVNDNWYIPSLTGYLSASIDIYNRYGLHIYHSAGYSKPWDGTYHNRPLPAGTYYCVVDLHTALSKPISGFVALLR